jgi:hypothetical protein
MPSVEGPIETISRTLDFEIRRRGIYFGVHAYAGSDDDDGLE